MDRIIEKKKWTVKKISLYGISAAFLFIVIFSIAFRDNSSKLNVDSDKITIFTVKKGPFNEFITVTGTIVPIKTVYLDAVEGGRVEQVYLEAGSMVNKGDKILKLTNTDLMMDIMFREAELADQSNNLRNTRIAMEQNRLQLKAQLLEYDYEIKRLKREYERNKELLKSELISRQKYEETTDSYQYNIKRRNLAIESFKQDSLFRNIQIRQLENSLKRMHESLDLVRSKLENLVIKAPVSGLLSSRNAEIGELKRAGERLGQIDVLDGFKVRASIDEHYLSRIHVGLQGVFPFANEEYTIVCRKIYPEITDGRFDVDMEFHSTEPEGIRRGQTVHIRLSLGDLSDALLLARGGFYQTTGGQWAYVLDKSGDYAIKRNIRLGRQNPQMFEVLEGLKPGDQVITSSYDNFGDNDKLILK